MIDLYIAETYIRFKTLISRLACGNRYSQNLCDVSSCSGCIAQCLNARPTQQSLISSPSLVGLERWSRQAGKPDAWPGHRRVDNEVLGCCGGELVERVSDRDGELTNR